MSTAAPMRNSRPGSQRPRMTAEQYAQWAFQQNFESEWVDGEVITRAPISSERDHLQWWIRNLLQFYVERRDLGLVIGPEFQVRLPRPSRREPDILFVAKQRLVLLKPTYLDGPPDLAVEIVSPSSESRDWREKYLEYQAAGVRECWVIDPMSQNIEAYAMGTNQSYSLIDENEGKLASTVVPGWYVKPAWLWQQPRPSVLDVLVELGVR